MFKQLFYGRLNRLPFIGGIILWTAIPIFVTAAVGSFIPEGESLDSAELVGTLMLLLAMLLVFIMSVTYLSSLVIRRLRDIDANPWFGLLLLIPFLNIPTLIIFSLLKSSPDSAQQNGQGASPSEGHVFCSSCGTKHSLDAKFCGKCGKKLAHG